MESTILQMRCRLAHVPRWVIVPTYRHQSVAEHTFRVMAIAKALAFWTAKPGLVDQVTHLAMDHDLEEAITGDIPAPAKGREITMSDIVADPPRFIVRLADRIEAYAYLKTWGVPSERQRNILQGLLGEISVMAQRNNMTDKVFEILKELEEE